MLTPHDDHAEVLTAWVDGEPSDRDAVQAALETPEGREYVYDLMALRRMVAITGAGQAAFPAASATPQWSRWIVRAAAAVLCVTAGYGVARVADRTPAATPVVVGPASVSGSAAPQPTHVIRFETGVDWRETSGGN